MSAGRRPGINDFWPRALLSPLVGPLIASLSGLIDRGWHSTSSLAASYVYFSIVAFVIWTGNRGLYIQLPRREDWFEQPWRRLAALLAGVVLFTIPAAGCLIWVWQRVIGDAGTNPYALPIALLSIVTVAVIITHVYETVFLLRDWESDRLRNARAEQARLESELKALGREVDPHFLFNSLNALTHLVDERRSEASAFITALGDTYRYVLDSRGRRLVPLAEELESLRRHETLASIRFAAGVSVEVDVSPSLAADVRLPPVTLAELFQNAIKHNVTEPSAPLKIRVYIDGESLVFANDLKAREARRTSTGIGLRNVSERFRLATGRDARWGVEGGQFVVRLPLIRAGRPT